MTSGVSGLLDQVEDRLHCINCVLVFGLQALCPETARPATCRYSNAALDPRAAHVLRPPVDRRRTHAGT